MVRLLAIALCLAAAACSSEGRAPLADVLVERIGALIPGSPPPPSTDGRAEALTRAAVEAAGATLIRAGLAAETGRFVMSGVSENAGFVTYASRLSQSVTLQGGLVTASRGIGFDLLAVEFAANDPVARPRAPDDWPQRVARTYVFPAPDPRGKRVTVTCRFIASGTATLEIVERVHHTRRILERCAGDATFDNLHFADAETGFVWQTQQWLGPRQGAIVVEVIEPFTGE